jgi:protein-S-isoprenylcysteine O-methyltransferase Ste14
MRMNRLQLIKNSLIGLFSLILVFQLLLLTSIIPYEYTWGGRLESYEQMLVFVTFSVALNSLFLYVLLVRANYVQSHLPTGLLKALLWFMVLVFAVNTVGNLFAITLWERYLATPVTGLLTVLLFRVAQEKPSPNPIRS